MSYTTSGDNTVFTYDVEQIFNRVRVHTATRLKMIRDGGTGELNYDQLSLTDLEENDFNIIYPHVASDIFVLIQSLAQGVDDAFEWDADEVTFILELPTYWDPNKTPILDLQIMNLFDYWISKEWFKRAGVPTIAQEFEVLGDQERKKVKSSIVSRTSRAQRRYRAL